MYYVKWWLILFFKKRKKKVRKKQRWGQRCLWSFIEGSQGKDEIVTFEWKHSLADILKRAIQTEERVNQRPWNRNMLVMFKEWQRGYISWKREQVRDRIVGDDIRVMMENGCCRLCRSLPK